MRTLLTFAFFAIFGTYALGKLGWVENVEAKADVLSVQRPAAPAEKPMRFTDRIAARHQTDGRF
ncbi:MAG: hypothetical protein GC134_04380 [Proteobacteria bacterium]|nr:hypothetical protein [Pseudomonadota bacterium]